MADLIDRDALEAKIRENSMRIRFFDPSVNVILHLIRYAPAVNCWIPVEDALPEKDGEYLVFTEYEDVFKCTFDSNEENKWGFDQDYRDPDTLDWAGATWTAVENVTHWMPLPEPPEKE